MNQVHLLQLIWTKSWLSLKSEAAKNYLGYLWWVLEPMIHMACYYTVFEVLLQRGGENYAVFLLVALVPWLWFAKSVNQAANSILGGRQLMTQVFIPKAFFPLVFVLQSFVKQLPVFLMLIGFLLLQGLSPQPSWWALLILIPLQLLFTTPVACLLAALVASVRDVAMMVPAALQFAFFCSGIFFSIDSIAPEYRSLFLLNPMAGLVEAYREVLVLGQWPDWAYLRYVLLLALVLLAATAFIYRRYEFTITKLVQE